MIGWAVLRLMLTGWDCKRRGGVRRRFFEACLSIERRDLGGQRRGRGFQNRLVEGLGS